MADQGYTLSIVQPEDYDDLESFLYDNFFADLPLYTVFGIEIPPPKKVFNQETIPSMAFVIKAVSKEGELIGVAINRTKFTTSPLPDGTDERFVQVFSFFQYVDKESRISDLPEDTIELRILSVSPGWRGRGVGKALSEESIRVAKERGFAMMKVGCVSEFTAMLVRTLGFEELYKLSYSNYHTIVGKDILMKSCPPHSNFYYFVKSLVE